MARSRYTITEPDKPHFLTYTVVEWLPVFTRPETVQILLDCWQYQQQQGLRLYGYVVLENHCHIIAQGDALNTTVARFKSYTARRIIDYLDDKQVNTVLKHLRYAKKAHKKDREYQFWQEGCHAELILNDKMMRQKLDYIHMNPVKRGYIERPEHWCYSSAGHYLGKDGLLQIDLWH
jgi:REP element-mobilizing transposase RayT